MTSKNNLTNVFPNHQAEPAFRNKRVTPVGSVLHQLVLSVVSGYVLSEAKTDQWTMNKYDTIADMLTCNLFH